jgi:hypothetical protein
MHELMSQQLATFRRRRLVLAPSEEDVAPDRERAGGYGPGKRSRRAIGVDPDVREGVAQRGTEGTCERALDRRSRAGRRRDCRFDLWMHDAAREDSLSVAHPGNRAREAAIAEC